MKKKTRFNPVVTRIKLNPEQAVLSCACYNTGNQAGAAVPASTSICAGRTITRAKFASGSTVS